MHQAFNTPLFHSRWYEDLQGLKDFHQQHPLHACFMNGEFSPSNTYHFFSTLAYETEDIGRCISLIVNVITLLVIQNFGTNKYGHYLDDMMNGRLITAICNNEALHHGSDLNRMKSYIKYNEDGSHDIHIDKKIITNVGAADLLFVTLSVFEKSCNKFVVLLFEGDEILQQSICDHLQGLASCPSGSLRMELKQARHSKIFSDTNKSLLVMRKMYNMERFLIGCIMSGILKKIFAYALQEIELDVTDKFSHQYLQDKVISIFSCYMKLDSLIKNCIQHMNQNSIVEPILALIKISCIDDVHQSLMILKELSGAKSYMKNHITTKLLQDHEAIYNLGGTKELMKQTLFNDLKNKKIRKIYG
jgi:alkylation response protein AidB-like acyl-CoA dehydrogenase